MSPGQEIPKIDLRRQGFKGLDLNARPPWEDILKIGLLGPWLEGLDLSDQPTRSTFWSKTLRSAGVRES